MSNNFPDLLGRIDTYLTQDTNRKRVAHYPSQASVVMPGGNVAGKCLRAQYYAWMGVEASNKITAHAKFKMEAGNAIHGRVSYWLQQMGNLAKEEHSFKAYIPTLEAPVSGRIDNVVVFQDVQKFFGVEVKTGYSKMFSSRTDGIKHHGPRLSDLIQIALYFPHIPMLGGFYLLYYARDNGDRYQFIVTTNEAKDIIVNGNIYHNLAERVYVRWVELEGYLAAKELPPRDYSIEYEPRLAQILWEEYQEKSEAKKPYSFKVWSSKHKGDWQCAYCQHLDTCQEEDYVAEEVILPEGTLEEEDGSADKAGI